MLDDCGRLLLNDFVVMLNFPAERISSALLCLEYPESTLRLLAVFAPEKRDFVLLLLLDSRLVPLAAKCGFSEVP